MGEGQGLTLAQVGALAEGPLDLRVERGQSLCLLLPTRPCPCAWALLGGLACIPILCATLTTPAYLKGTAHLRQN